jgi:mRNA interferase RelE/StbE
VTNITFSREALKFVKQLDSKPARQVYEKTLALLLDPHPQSATELRGFKGFLRLRVGNYRVIYSKSSELIRVVLIDNRSDDDVYKHLDRLK